MPIPRTTLAALVFALVASVAMPRLAVAQTAPGAPTNVQASVSGNTVSLTWGPPSSGGAPRGRDAVRRRRA